MFASGAGMGAGASDSAGGLGSTCADYPYRLSIFIRDYGTYLDSSLFGGIPMNDDRASGRPHPAQ